MPGNSTDYAGQVVHFGGATLRYSHSRVEFQADGYRASIVGGRLFVEHDSHKPYLDRKPDTIYVVNPLHREKLDTDPPSGLN